MTILKYKGFIYAALIAIACAYFAAKLVGYFFPVPPKTASAFSSVQSGKTQTPGQLFTSVTDRNLFDIDIIVPPSEVAGENSTVNTNFEGKLTGVIVGKKRSQGRAIIVMPNKDVYALKVDIPQDDLVLLDVDNISARIQYSGREYHLTLEDSGAPGTTSPRPLTPATSPATAAVPSDAAPSTQSTDSSGGTEHISLHRGEMMDQLKDINTVIRSLLVSPLFVDGNFQGYRVARMQENSPVRQLGLQPGDIINRINGEELSSPEVLFGMLSKIDEINAVSIDVTRGGEKKTLFVEIQ